MDKGDKSSPSPGQNIFDTASLLGANPFAAGLSALPFAHLSHIPSAFSMLGHHPAFPVTSLFGHLDGLGSQLMSPSSLSQSLSPTSSCLDSYLSPFLFTIGQGQPLADPLRSMTSVPTSLNEKYSTIRSSLFTSSPTPTSSPSSPRVSTATPSHTATSTTSSIRSSSGSSSSRRKGGPGSRGRPRKLQKQSSPPPVPLSLVSGAYKTTGTILSPSQLLKQRKRECNGTNGLDHASQLDLSISSLVNDIHQEKVSRRKSHSSKPPTILNAPKSPSKVLSTDNAISLLSTAPHIDGLKKRLIADQIRQRVQNKALGGSTGGVHSPQGSMSPPPSTSRHRGSRGRSSKNAHHKDMSGDDLEEKKQRQEELKRQLEAELKQQQIALRMMKKANSGKDRSSDVTPSSSSSPSKHEPLTLHLTKCKPHEYKLTQASSPTKQDVSPGTSTQKTSELMVAKFKKLSKDGSSISSSGETDGSGSDSDSDSETSTGTASDTVEDPDASRSGNEASNKRPHETDSMDGSSNQVKRRRVVLDESDLQIPIAQGWKRQTNIHSYGRRGIVGEVWYFGPCGRKLKTIPDVMRYLDRNTVSGLGRDNFSFNTKVHVGEFYEAREGQNGFVKLSDSEIEARLSATVSRRRKKIESQRKQEKLQLQQMLAKQLMDAKIKQKLVQQGPHQQELLNEFQDMARKVAEMQFQNRLEKQHQKEMLKRAKQMRLLEKQKQKEQRRLMKEQEKIQRQEQIRMEREMRAQQIMENRRIQREAKEQRKYVETIRKAQEREMKRQQAAMLKEQVRQKQERERRRQHLLLLKALEQRKKQEDRERMREEKITEKRLLKERKEEQRRMEIVLAQELKKPREDMELLDLKEMPEFSRIPGNQLEGNLFGEVLMVLEFLHNFGTALGFDDETLPTLKTLQDGIINKTDEDGEEYISLVTHLMRYALDDPGVPNPKEAVTQLGQKIVDVEVSENVLSEILRIFMVARNGKEDDLTKFLVDHPVEACSVEDRSAILAFLCNELNCSKNITGEIEKQLDHMGDIRRDKWVIEGKLRRLRVIQARKFRRPVPKPVPEADTSVLADGEDSMATTISLSSKVNSDEEEEKENPEEIESGNESDPGSNNKEAENITDIVAEEEPSTIEECEKRIEKLQKQHAQYREKVFEESHKIRAVTFGEDRYRRRYWALTCAGGIYIEGMESGMVPEHSFEVNSGTGKDKTEKVEVKKELEGKEEKDISMKADQKPEVKADIMPEVKADSKPEIKADIKPEMKTEAEAELKSVLKEDLGEVKQDVKREQVNCLAKDENEEKNEGELSVKENADGTIEMKDAEKKTEVKMEVDSQPDSGVPVKDTSLIHCEVKSELDVEMGSKSAINGDLQSEEVVVQKESVFTKDCSDVKDFKDEGKTVNGFEHSIEQTEKSATKDHVADSEETHVETKTSESCRNGGSELKSVSKNKTNCATVEGENKMVQHCYPHKGVELKIPIVKSSSSAIDIAGSKDESSLFVRQYLAADTKLPDICNISPNSLIKTDPAMVLDNSANTAQVTSILTSHNNPIVSISSNHNASSPALHHYSSPSASSSSSLLSLSSSSLPQPPPAHSKLPVASSLATPKPNFMSIDSILKKEAVVSSVTNNQFFPPGILPLSPFTDVLKPVREHTSSDQKPWFSILPRVPCDDMSLTRGQHQSLSPAMLTSSPYMPQLQFPGFSSLHSPSPSFPALQMSQLFGSPSDFNISSRSSVGNTSTASLSDSFKVPEIPGSFSQSSQQAPDPEEVLKTLQGEAKPIPEEFQKSWWKINDIEELRQLQKCLHPRGIREKSLQKTIQKFSDFATASLTSADKDVICMESSSDSDNSDDEEEETEETKVKAEEKKETEKEKKKKKKKNSDDDKGEEDKKGDEEKSKNEEQTTVVKEVSNNVTKATEQMPKPVIDTNTKVHEADMAVLDEVESLEDRIASASLQIKGWKLAARTSYEESKVTIIPRHQPKTAKAECYPLESAQNRLLQLEANVERRYLKPPLCKAQKISLTSLTTSHDDRNDEVDNENLPAGLQTWRNAVTKATSPAQVMLCILQLNKSISWEKSIMKVLCQICRKDDNEAELLLCDGCDRGYHTYCFRPKLEAIPEGDWYCYECISKAMGESCCIVCGKRLGRLVECSSCPRAIHIDCMDPPLARVPRKWTCASCQDGKGKKRNRKSSTASSTAAANTSTTNNSTTSTTSTTTTTTTSANNSRKRKSDTATTLTEKSRDSEPVKVEVEKSPEKKKSGQLDKERRKQAEASSNMVICRLVLMEMEKHEDGWPFLQAVNCKEFTSYKKFIKQPMDFSSMKNKLRDNVYKTRSEFSVDAHLVFENCKTFNEDDSEVGQCGHSMRKFFEKRWKELLISSLNEENSKKDGSS